MADTKFVLKVTGMTCGHCKAKVEKAVQKVPGVTRATVDLAKGEIEVQGNVSLMAVIGAILDAGYEAAGL